MAVKGFLLTDAENVEVKALVDGLVDKLVRQAIEADMAT